MQVEALEVLGLVGVTLVIATGSIFEGLRKWCLGFKHPLNLFRWFGELISCPMCAGAWVGVGWAWLDGQSTLAAIVTGGLISLLSMLADMALGLVHTFAHKQSGGDKTDAIRQLLQARAERRTAMRNGAHNAQVGGEDLSEDQADALLDEQTESADRTVE